MKSFSIGFALIALGAVSGTLPPSASCAEAKPGTVPRWEYRVLTKGQVRDLGKGDLAAALNKLGDEGWELVAVEPAYIFKRPREQQRPHGATIEDPVVLAASKVEIQKGRVEWAERMVRAGSLPKEVNLEAERAKLRQAEIALKEARIKYGIAVAEIKVEIQKGRVEWAERMVRAGSLPQPEAEAERAKLRRAEIALEEARKELKLDFDS
jgi:hypothetical protein